MFSHPVTLLRGGSRSVLFLSACSLARWLFLPATSTPSRVGGASRERPRARRGRGSRERASLALACRSCVCSSLAADAACRLAGQPATSLAPRPLLAAGSPPGSHLVPARVACRVRAMGPPPGIGVYCRGGCGAARLLAWCFLLALSPHAPGSRGAEAVWTAYLNVSWRVPHTGVNRTVWELSEEGVYGQDSPLEPVSGVLVPPDGPGALNACNPHTNFTVPTVWGSTVQVSWLALIQRGGGCTFADKIHLASERGASGAVIFNFPGTRNEVIPMSHPGAGDIVAIMIGNLKGTKILQSIQRGIQVTMVIEVGKKHGPWVNHYSIFFVSVSFFIITAATVGYFIFYSARRLRNARAQSRKQRQLKADAKKAIGRLQLRTLKQGDKEIGPDGDSCAVCIELYKPNDLVRILTCNHIFHKTCVDPWLLEHRTCPMCKCDILKALGIEVDVEDGSVSLQVPVSNDASNTASPHEEDNRSETASSGYASVQGADEPPLEEHAQSANENLQLVNHEANSVAVDVVPHVDNPTFEEDETPDQEAAVREIKS